MITIEMVKTLLEIVALSITVGKQVFSKKGQKEIAEWTINLGKIVEEVADKLQKNDYPHGLCARMDQHVHKFSQIIEGKLADAEVQTLQQLLIDAVEIERVHAQLRDLTSEQREHNLKKMWEVSGKLIATGEQMLLKV